MKKRLVGIVLLMLFMHDLFAQCRMCSAVLESEIEDDKSGGGINSAILYLMVFPYIILFIVFRKKIVAFWKEFKNAKG